jgi:exodeoxyribonuclease-5
MSTNNVSSGGKQHQGGAGGGPGGAGDVRLSAEQRDFVDAILAGIDDDREEQTGGGYAGSGKTTCIRELHRRLPGFAVVAPTGRAAAVLGRKGIPASTIHSRMHRAIFACRGRCSREGVECRCRFVGWEKKDSLDCDGIICDEASMVSRKVHDDLLSYGIQYIFVGDHGQLPPVIGEREKALGLPPFNLMESPDYRLEHVHRNAGELAWFARDLREGRPASWFRPRTDAVVITDATDRDALPIMQADQVICARNSTRIELNRYVRARLGHNALVEPGERVMCLRNDHRETTLCNGTLATVLAVYPGDHTFDLDSEEGVFRGVRYDPARFGVAPAKDGLYNGGPLPFDYGYASTCHKSQGGEWPTVLVFEEWLGYLWEHRRWCYTAASRAQGRLVWRTDRPIRRPASVIIPSAVRGGDA